MDELERRMVAVLEPARDAAAAGPMERYMRNQFAFLGIATPRRRSQQRHALEGWRPDRAALLDGVRALWDRPEREYQYAACDVLVRHSALLAPRDLDVLATLVTTKPWWDTVDALAINLVGPVVQRDRANGDPVVDTWIRSADVWSARTAILHQNRWKAATDEPRLFALCLARAGDTDFFVRKAIGWALREHSKLAPTAVEAFVDAHDDVLSGLSKREALRVLRRGGRQAGQVTRFACGGTSER